MNALSSGSALTHGLADINVLNTVESCLNVESNTIPCHTIAYHAGIVKYTIDVIVIRKGVKKSTKNLFCGLRQGILDQ